MMKHMRSYTLPAGLLLATVLLASGLLAQTVIGGITPDPARALHVIKTGSMTDPLRLTGLRESTTLDQVLVVDPTTGVPMYRDAASLATSGEWSYDTSVQGIYATRAAGVDGIGGAGDDFVITDAGQMGIGITPAKPGIRLTIDGVTHLEDDSRLQFRDNLNYIYSPANNNNWYFKGQSYVSFRNRNNTADLLTIQANSQRVGIKETDPAFGVDFEVNGTQRMQDAHDLQFGTENNRIYAHNLNDWRFSGQTKVNFMNRAESNYVMSLDANTELVGIGTVDPQAKLHVHVTGDRINSTRGNGFNVGSNTVYLSLDETEIQAYNNSGPAATRLGIQAEGGGVIVGENNRTNNFLEVYGETYLATNGPAQDVGIGTRFPDRKLHVVGDARITGLPTVTSDNFIVTANSAGDLQKVTPANLANFAGDNLGNHIADENIQLQNSWLSNDGGNEGIRVNNSGQVGIGTNNPQQTLHVNGRARVSSLPDAVDPYVVTSDANGNLTRRTATALASVHWTQNAFGEIYNTTLNNVGVNITDPLVAFDIAGTALIRDRLWMGSTDPRFIGDPLPLGINAGMHPTDGAIWVPTYTGTQTSNLRLYVPNDADDEFSIWGNNCGAGDCGDLFASDRVVSFRGDGDVTFDGSIGINTAPVAGKVLSTNGQIRFTGVNAAPNSGRQYWILLVDVNGNLYRSRSQANGNTTFDDPTGPAARASFEIADEPEQLSGPMGGELKALQRSLTLAERERDQLAERNAALERRLQRIEELLSTRAER